MTGLRQIWSKILLYQRRMSVHDNKFSQKLMKTLWQVYQRTLNLSLANLLLFNNLQKSKSLKLLIPYKPF